MTNKKKGGKRIEKMQQLYMPQKLERVIEDEFQWSGGWGDPSTHPYPVGTKVWGDCPFHSGIIPKNKVTEQEFLGTDRRFYTRTVGIRFNKERGVYEGREELYKGNVNGRLSLVIPIEEYEGKPMYLYRCLEGCGAIGAPSDAKNVGITSYYPYEPIVRQN